MLSASPSASTDDTVILLVGDNMPLFAGVPYRLSVDPRLHILPYSRICMFPRLAPNENPTFLGSKTKSWTWGWLMGEP